MSKSLTMTPSLSIACCNVLEKVHEPREKEHKGTVSQDEVCVVQRCHLDMLPKEQLFEVLSYLRSMDFVSLSEVNKTIFGPECLDKALRHLLVSEYRLDARKVLPPEGVFVRPAYAYVQEIKLISAVLTGPPMIHCAADKDKYYVSASWMANARKYYEALTLPDVDTGDRKTPQKKKKMQRIRARRGSEALPPWPDINADITCEHGNLATSKGIRAKRRIINIEPYRVLQKFYPLSTPFRVDSVDCPLCSQADMDAKAAEALRVKEEVEARQAAMTPHLWLIAHRSKGLPHNSLVHIDEDTTAAIALALQEGHSLESLRRQPLVPGIYHLVPRVWLRTWRAFVKGDKEIRRVPTLDSTCLLCSAHGLLVPPPHVTRFLQGVRGKKYLLGGLGLEYPGLQYEIVTTDEFDALASHASHIEGSQEYPDFTVRFSCDGEAVVWSTDTCSVCDPFNMAGPLV